MRFSCVTDAFPMLPHDVSLELIARLGFDAHDLTLIAGSVVTLDGVRADIAGWAGRLDERVRSRRLEFSDVAAWADYETMAPNHPDPAKRRRGSALFEDMLELTVRLAAPGLTLVPGIDWPHETHEGFLVRAATELGRRASAARDRGVRFSVEPHVGSVCKSPGDIARLCELAPDLELTLDYTHYVSQGFTEPEIEPLLARARHVHVRGGTNGRLQTSLRDTTIDYERIVDVLRGHGYDGYLQLEYVWGEWGSLNQIDVVSETILLLDRLRAKLADEPWSYPQFGWPTKTVEAPAELEPGAE
jgi:sugar phosphate isomerase/epimerase